MECAQIRVTGGSGAKQPTTYSIPGVYKVSRERTANTLGGALRFYLQSNDPGLLINIYPMKGSYTIPGT